MKAKQIFIFIFLLAGLVVFVWFLDLRMGRTFFIQYQSESYPSVKGAVISGTVTHWAGSKGQMRYHPSLLYRYTVNGLDYQSRRFRYDGHPVFNTEMDAQQIVDAHPKGSVIDVYYNPQNPRDALLSTGIDTRDLGIPFLFGGLTFMLLSAIIQVGRKIDWFGKGMSLAGDVPLIDDRMTIRARLPSVRPAESATSLAFIASMIAGSVFANRNIQSPPVQTGLATLAGIVLACLTLYFFLRNRILSGRYDLVIDEGTHTLGLPVTFPRRKRESLSFSDVIGVNAEKIMAAKRSRSNLPYGVVLQLRDGDSETIGRLPQANAEAFAAWLRDKLNLKAPSVAPPAAS